MLCRFGRLNPTILLSGSLQTHQAVGCGAYGEEAISMAAHITIKELIPVVFAAGIQYDLQSSDQG